MNIVSDFQSNQIKMSDNKKNKLRINRCGISSYAFVPALP
jgi:hypothetical protein